MNAVHLQESPTDVRILAADLLRRADELTATVIDNCPPHGIERPTR